MNGNTMKKIALMLLTAVSVTTAAFGAGNVSPAMLGCENAGNILAAGKDLELGHWYTDWASCKKWCDKKNVPMLAIWSNNGCIHCYCLGLCFLTDKFKTWAAENDAGKVIYCYMEGGMPGYPDQKGSEGYNWSWKVPTTLGEFPFVSIYWKGHGTAKQQGVILHKTGDQFRCNKNGTQPANFWGETKKLQEPSVVNIEYWMETTLKDWHPEPEITYAGGYFTQTNYPYASLQAESKTAFVNVEIVRTATAATNQTMKIVGAQTKSVSVTWGENQLSQTYPIKNFDTTYFTAGKDVVLQLIGPDKAGADEVKSEVRIKCFTAAEEANSTGNPKWVTESFKPGEWTMDFKTAKQKVKQGTDGYKYLLVCAQGSLWCPDCGRVEKNFLGQTDESGNNRFAAWAKSKKVALVTVDIPNYQGSDINGTTSPCLLKKDPHDTDPEASGTAMPHSGLGYLTRKMATDLDAAEVLATNHYLVTSMTYEGGFNRPEERDYKNRKYRCGAPVFILMDKFGNVRSELVRLAEDSTHCAGNFDNYIRRFNEMLAICDDNATEIEDNYASETGSVKFKANGGWDHERLCNADMYDTFLLDVSGNAMQQVVVKGWGTAGTAYDADCEVAVEFQKLGADGVAVPLQTVIGTLGKGVTNLYTFTESGNYYVQVRGWGSNRAAGYNSEAFKLASTKDGHFQNYSITGLTILVPQEDLATARAPEGSKEVQIQLKKTEPSGVPIVYHIEGLAEDGCAQLQEISGYPGYYTAKADGIATATVTVEGGAISYQIWHPGSVGFARGSQTVPERYCYETLGGKPMRINVSRNGGKSGTYRIFAKVNTELTTLYPDVDDDGKPLEARFNLCADAAGTPTEGPIELEWKDGDVEPKSIWVYVHYIDLYYGDGKLVLDLYEDPVMSEIPYGGEIEAEHSQFTLTVKEEDKADLGRAMVVAAGEPVHDGRRSIFVREGDVATAYLSRIEAGYGLASVRLTCEQLGDDSLYGDVIGGKQVTVYPDENDGNRLHFSWDRRETGVKRLYVEDVKAGQTAKVMIESYGGFKVVSASNYVNVVGLRSDAPGFKQVAHTAPFVRNIAGGYVADLEMLSATASTDTVSFCKFSGTLPAGLTVGYAEREGRKVMYIEGSTTAKAGVYEVVYQVREERAGETVDGLLAHFSIVITDPTAAGEHGEPAVNPACSASRSLSNLPVYDEANKRLAGVVQLTLPPSGKASARFSGFAGSISFAATGWASEGLGGKLQADLVSNREGWKMTVEALADGTVNLGISDPDGKTYLSATDGKAWKKAPKTAFEASAKPLEGYYTVVTQPLERMGDDAPTGDGYLTLKMNTSSGVNSGTFTMAGMLPNGTKVSGSFALVQLTEDDESVHYVLPIFRSSTRDAVSAVVEILPDAQAKKLRRCVFSPDYCDGYWRHEEAAGSYEETFTLHGSYYDADEDLGICCVEFFKANKLNFYANGVPVGGEPGKPSVVVGEDKKGNNAITLEGENPGKLKLSFVPSTGVVSGTFTDGAGRGVSYAGVIVNGWGEDCGCGNYDTYLPFMSGSCFWNDLGKDGLKRVFGAPVSINK